MKAKRTVQVKWVMNPCHLGNTSMPNGELAILACPRGNGEWAVAYKNKKSRSLVEPCFAGFSMENLGQGPDGRTVVIVDPPESEAGGIDRDCDPEVLTGKFDAQGLRYTALNEPVWLAVISA